MTRRPGPGISYDAQEFERLLGPHLPALYKTAFRWTAARDQAEDLVQELLLKLYPRLDELRGLDKPRPWALRVMYRIFVDQQRREQRAPVRPEWEIAGTEEAPSPQSELPDPGPDLPELVAREAAQARIAEVWETLSDEHRVVLALHDMEDYTLPELQGMLELPLGTLKSRLHRARARLRELLETEPLVTSVRVRE